MGYTYLDTPRLHVIARALGRLLVGGRKELFPDPAGLKASPLALHPAFYYLPPLSLRVTFPLPASPACPLSLSLSLSLGLPPDDVRNFA